jgi:DNA-binding TFAR19-related protein (PDSD5 family)
MLNTNAAEAQLLAILDDQATRLDRPEKARQDFARDLVRVMVDLIRSGTVSATTGVTTFGSATTQAGQVTITNGKIS